jgi:hypothetical protein
MIYIFKIKYIIKMSNFPLYDQLCKEIPNKDLTIKQKRKFIEEIQNFDENGYELMYALIRVYQLLNEKNIKDFEIPYEAMVENENKTVTYNLEKLPKKLKQILFKFIEIHIIKMEEEEIKINLTPVPIVL